MLLYSVLLLFGLFIFLCATIAILCFRLGWIYSIDLILLFSIVHFSFVHFQFVVLYFVICCPIFNPQQLLFKLIFCLCMRMHSKCMLAASCCLHSIDLLRKFISAIQSVRQVGAMYSVQNSEHVATFLLNLKVNFNMENHNSCDDLFDWSEWRSIRQFIDQPEFRDWHSFEW